MFIKRSLKTLIIVMLALVLTAGTFAFAEANTVPTSKAGDGHGAVSGYTISAVHYNLNVANPTLIDSVTFNLNSTPVAGSTIRIKLVAAGSTWYTCTNSVAVVTCDNGSTLGVTVLSVNDLQVVISD